jgi:type IV pilus assembly protein PilY1
MRFANSPLKSILIGLALTTVCTSPVRADDSEVFTSTAYLVQNAVRPNILFIVDTSGSMDTGEPNYNPALTYTGPCRANAFYYKRYTRGNPDDTPPNCLTNPDSAYINATSNRCAASKSTINSAGVYTGKMQQFNPGSPNGTWKNFTDGKPDWKVECQADDKVHGDFLWSAASSGTNYRANNNSSGWEKTNSINWGNNGVNQYTLYSSNYANWYYGDSQGSRTNRLDIVRDAANSLIDELKGVNLGLARYDTDAQGGMITVPIGELTDTQRTLLKTTLKSYMPEGNTPLSETLFEAARYFTGGAVDYGLKSDPVHSVADSREGGGTADDGLPGNYKSPMKYSCQKNYIVYLTDGLPTTDNDADDKIVGFTTPGGTDSHGVSNSFQKVMGEDKCSTVKDPNDPTKDASDQNGKCLDDLAGYLNKVDTRGDLYGVQNVSTFVIGFGDDVKESKSFLDAVAKAGGSEHAYTASNSSALTTTLQDIFAKVADDANLTFTSPTVSVNAFNRAQNLNDLYVSVFSPNQTMHWDGNLKKYTLVNSAIYGVSATDATKSVPAVNPETGFFFEDAKSYWSSVTDGFDVTKGGAASKLPDYADNARVLFTNLGATPLNADGNLIKDGNTGLKATDLGLASGDSAGRTAVIAFARGKDLTDINGDDVFTDKNFQMGDPMHARPAVVIYGGTTGSPDVNDAIAYLPTNDGYLHAINTKDGVEKWAFVPPEFLPRLKERFDNPVIGTERSYALDGDVRVLKYDKNGDGIITYDDGDRVYIYFGFGRGGSVYYALDVSKPGAPTLLWRKNATDLVGLAQAWSTPVVARVNVTGVTQNTNKFVLIFGGGYDNNGQEGYNYSVDTVGNRIFMLDAVSGATLWSAGPDTSSANLKLKKMTHSIPGNITVIDTDADGLADRMYAGDMGGRVWRFDITNGNGAGTLVTGGVFASLGTADISPVSRADTRRFYYAPDVALFSPRGAKPYYNLAIGSGYRGHPLEEDTHDRFYSLRDYAPFSKLSQTDYYDLSTRVIPGDGDLVDLTKNANGTVADGALGWKIELSNADGTWHGQKVLAEAITVGGVILFPTFQPNGQNTDNPCLPATLNRVYAVTADNARPFADNNHDGDKKDLDDRATALKQGGIAAGISVIVDNGTTPQNTTCKAGDVNCVCDKNNANCKIVDPGSTCLAGVEVLKTCVPVGGAVRTFWNRK